MSAVKAIPATRTPRAKLQSYVGRPLKNVNPSESTPATPEARAKLAYDLSETGMSWREVAAVCGYANESGASAAARRHMWQMRRELERVDMLAKLEQLYAVVAPRAAAGNARAQEQLMRILAQQIRIGGFDQDSPLAAAFLAEHPARRNTPEDERWIDEQVAQMAANEPAQNEPAQEATQEAR